MMAKCNAPWKNARQWSENGDPAWVQEQLPKWKKLEEAQREMLRFTISELFLFELEASISWCPTTSQDRGEGVIAGESAKAK